MPSKLHGSIIINAKRTRVWDLLFQPETLRSMLNQIPGVTIERIDQVAENRYGAGLKISTPMIAGEYTLTIQVVEESKPELAKLCIEGKGGVGSIAGSLRLDLAEIKTRTGLSYEGEASIHGPFAALGEQFFNSAGRQVISSAMLALARELERRASSLAIE